MAIYQVRQQFYLHKKQGAVNRAYQPGEQVELTELEYDLYAHQVEPVTDATSKKPEKSTKEAA